MKVVRIMRAQDGFLSQYSEVTQPQSLKTTKLKIRISKFGVSFVNSSMRELSYLFVLGLSMASEMTATHLKLNLKIRKMQIDD